MDRSEIIEKLSQYIRTDLLNRKDYPLTEEMKLITDGIIDSFSLAQIGVFIEDAFNVYIPDTELTVARMNTLAQMADRILERLV